METMVKGVRKTGHPSQGTILVGGEEREGDDNESVWGVRFTAAET